MLELGAEIVPPQGVGPAAAVPWRRAHPSRNLSDMSRRPPGRSAAGWVMLAAGALGGCSDTSERPSLGGHAGDSAPGGGAPAIGDAGAGHAGSAIAGGGAGAGGVRGGGTGGLADAAAGVAGKTASPGGRGGRAGAGGVSAGGRVES